MKDRRSLNILALNYHEATKDARVFKQAKALAAEGHKVGVMCRLLPGDTPVETVDDIAIHRFECFSHSAARPDDLASMSFLERSYDLIQDRYAAYANAAMARRRVEWTREWLSELKLHHVFDQQGVGLLESNEKSVYKSPARYIVRDTIRAMRRRIGGLPAAANATLFPVFLKGLLRTLKLRDRELAKTLSERFRELYQGRSIVFAVNLMRQRLPFVPDIVHAHDFFTLPAAILVAQRTGARIIYDAHEYEPGRATMMPPEGNEIIDIMERECLPHVSRMTTVSRSIADLYAERFSGPYPTLIMNTPDLRLAAPADPEATPGRLHELAGLPPETRIIVFTGGTQRENRGLDRFCDALALLPDFHFVALGPRNEKDDQWLRGHAERAGVLDRMTLLPSVEAHEVVDTIADAEVAICVIQDAGISYRYAMPNKLFEAAFAGLPIVVSDLPEMRRFVEEFGIGEPTDQTNPSAIAETISNLCAERSSFILNDERLSSMVSHYSWEFQERKLVQLVQSILPTK